MFGLPATSLIGYGIVAALGAGGIGWVWHVVDERDTLRIERAELSEGLRRSKQSIVDASETASKALKAADAARAQAERENRQASSQMARLRASINDPKPSTCDAAVLEAQAAMP